MNTWSLAFGALALMLSVPATAQNDPNIHIPDTSIARPADAGRFAHTNHVIFAGIQPIDPLDQFLAAVHGPALAAGVYYYPDQIHAAYGVPYSGSGAIAIVGAYHYKTALNDFNVFSATTGLPQETGSKTVFEVVFANGSQPRPDGGWAQEAALDIEWSHAMAPNAKIYLVEAGSNSFSNLMRAVDVAKALPGVRCVSMSWGSNEFSGETGTAYDGHFTSGGPFFASSGDSGGVISWPAVSTNVIGVGGTSLTVNGTAGNYSYGGESAWSGTGCGTSLYEPHPSYQTGTSRRKSADISAVADPYTGVVVYDSTSYQGFSGWMVFGGTSASSPICAGIFNASASGSTSSLAELTRIYSSASANWHDVTTGTAGSNSAGVGYDLPTGVGSPNGNGGF